MNKKSITKSGKFSTLGVRRGTPRPARRSGRLPEGGSAGADSKWMSQNYTKGLRAARKGVPGRRNSISKGTE